MNISKIGKKLTELPKPIITKATTAIEAVQIDSDVVMKHMDSIGAVNSARIKTFDLSKAQMQLQERLSKLDTETALHRWEGDNQRFGKEGISDIMQNATSKDNIALINAKLDELEQGKSIWAGNITDMFPQSKFKEDAAFEISMLDDCMQESFAGPISSILTEKSTNPKVIEFEEKMKKMGYNANFSDNIEAAEIITNAYQTLTKKGIKMPNDVQLMIPEEAGILGFRPYAPKGQEFETPILFNKNLSRTEVEVPFGLAQYGIKHNATDSLESVVYHEAGHFLHDFSRPDLAKSGEIWQNLANDGYDIDLAKEVGYYAMMGDKFNMGNEYVAEGFAGLMEGKEYGERVMDIYYKLGGPRIK